ncbi:transposase [Micromonospora zhanjiangensis]|uniref:Transposase n=1 Tax=Micromonospora zhanjiangensis TaxID=1522057 RepID=A0ABV8KQV2_9ACTN
MQIPTAAVRVDFGAQLREFNGEDDHVHLLVHYPPSVALSRLVNSLKGVSVRRPPQEHHAHPHRPCGATTCGHRRTSPDRAPAHPSPSPAKTSRTRNVPDRDGVPPGRKRPGSRLNYC